MDSKLYDYFFTELAEADINDTISYIIEDLCNPVAASTFVDRLEAKLEEICKNPKTGRLVENVYLRRDDVRRFLVDNYVAYYIVDEEERKVVILRVVYGKRNLDKILKKM